MIQLINCDDNLILKLPGPADDVEDEESLYSADYKIRQLTKKSIFGEMMFVLLYERKT